MKKIKITEKQAKLLETLNSKKVLKVTKEQYNRIIESELNRPSLTETPELHEEEINEDLFREFVNELYGLNEEGAECKYEKLNRVMEAAGLIEGGKLVKEKFGKDARNVKKVVGKGLMKYEECGSVYEAVQCMEESLSHDDIVNSSRRQTLQNDGPRISGFEKGDGNPEILQGKIRDLAMGNEFKSTEVLNFLNSKDGKTNLRQLKDLNDLQDLLSIVRDAKDPNQDSMELDEREHLGANQIKLNDLTFEKVKEFFPNFYQKSKGNQTNKDMLDDYYSYSDSINFPNPNDSLTTIENKGIFEYWKNKTLAKYGDVTLEFNPDEVWSRRVKIINNPSFDNDEKRFVDIKRRDLDSWREKSNSGLDETSLGGDTASGGVGNISYDTQFGSGKPAFKSNVSTELEEAVNLKDVVINIPDENKLKLIKNTSALNKYFSPFQLKGLKVGDNEMKVNHRVYGNIMPSPHREIFSVRDNDLNESKLTSKIYEALKKK